MSAERGGLVDAPDDTYRALIDVLLEATEKGVVAWSEEGAAGSTYYTGVGSLLRQAGLAEVILRVPNFGIYEDPREAVNSLRLVFLNGETVELCTKDLQSKLDKLQEAIEEQLARQEMSRFAPRVAEITAKIRELIEDRG